MNNKNTLEDAGCQQEALFYIEDISTIFLSVIKIQHNHPSLIPTHVKSNVVRVKKCQEKNIYPNQLHPLSNTGANHHIVLK